MKPKIVSWNVRGMNEIEKRWKIRRLLREWKADIVCLQETKLEVISREVIRSVWGVYMLIGCIWGRGGLLEVFY
jgi:exonuclease III